MPSGFTEFVRRLPNEHDSFLARAVFDQLRMLLSSELKRRGLWDSPPSYLGISGGVRWLGGGEPGSALEELTAECFAFIFIDRLQSLRAQLKVKPNLDGLVALNVRHFVLERQRAGDPLGFKVFEMLQAAVRDALLKEALRILAGDPQVRNETVLGFEATARLEERWEDLTPLVTRWNDRLMPDLVTANGRRQLQVRALLEELVLGLREQGVRCFRFHDVVDPLKRDARGRWSALFPVASGASGEVSAKGRWLAELRRTEPSIEDELGFRQLKRCVAAAIKELPEPRLRGYLSTLWRFLEAQAGGEETSPDISLLEEGDGSGHSHRKLAQHLRIPRDRMPELFATLRQLVARCQSAERAPGKGEDHAER